jgi:hypothetical protein
LERLLQCSGMCRCENQIENLRSLHHLLIAWRKTRQSIFTLTDLTEEIPC